jgi:hypothetical protein
MSGEYEVVLSPVAIRAVLTVPKTDRRKLADALRTELMNGPNADKELKLELDWNAQAHADPSANVDRIIYTATPLSHAGCTAVHRPMTEAELKQLRREQGRLMADQGFYIIDILPAESAFSRPP